MAIKKPAWDLSAAEIQKRADALPVLDRAYFARQQTRADTRSSPTTRADDEILAALARTMTADQAKAFAQAVARGENPNIADFVSRADSTVTNGMKMIVTRCEETDRKIRTFECLPGVSKRRAWMGDFMAAPQEQVMLNIKALPKDEFPSIERQWRENRAMKEQVARDIAAGKDVRFDIETGERVS